MRLVFALPCLLFCAINICLAADASTAVAAGGAAAEWYKSIFDLGVAGSFIGYLIYDRHVERTRKDKENERWEKMDGRLLVMAENETRAKMELASALMKLQASHETMIAEVRRLVTIITTGNDYHRRVADRD